MTSISKSFYLSSSLKEEMMVSKKQGIVSILVSDIERTKSTSSLRRTLSADMSSKKWQAQHGFSPLKKIASSEGFSVCIADLSSSSEGEEEYEDNNQKDTEEIWSSIQQEKKKQLENPGHFDIWSSIIAQKTQDSKMLPPPYTHPLVKRSASCLSGKSLEICTESLGSETGSDGFSSYAPSEAGEAEEDKEEEQRQQERAAQKLDMEDLQVVKYNNLAAASKKTTPKSFPPPISSLSSRDGTSMRMKSHRDNGRLVLEAVSISSLNNFVAQRQDGRLVLTFANNIKEEEDEEEAKKLEENQVEQFEVEMDKFDEDEMENEGDDEEEEDVDEDEEEMDEDEVDEEEQGDGGGGGEVRFVVEQAPKLSSGLMNVHRLALMMNKPIILANRNPTIWTTKQAKFEEEMEEEDAELVNPITPITQSLPPRPTVARMIQQPVAAVAAATAKAAASSFNACEYCWKSKPLVATILKPISQKAAPIRNNYTNNILSNNMMGNDQRNNNGDNYFVPWLKSCKEQRKVPCWEPYCIATS